MVPIMRGRGAARQLRIGIERNDKPDICEHAEIARFHRKRIEFLTQQLIQIEKLAAFALPSHPRPLLRIVNAMTVKEEKLALPQVCIALVEFVYQTNREFDSAGRAPRRPRRCRVNQSRARNGCSGSWFPR